MIELSQDEREQIQQQILLVKNEQELTVIPTNNVSATPDVVLKNLEETVSAQAIPNKKETHRIIKRIRGIWSKWRSVTLDAKSLEVEKIACKIKIERAETKAKLNEVKRKEKASKITHWLKLNAGNLKDLGYNTESKPSMFWYNINRGFYHITKLTGNIPKLIKNLFWVGLIVIALVLLKHYNVL